MKSVIEQRLKFLSNEIEQLYAERSALANRDSEIQVRLHQLIGAVYELQQLILDPGHLQAAEVQRPFWDSDPATHPSVSDVQDSHQEKQEGIETNSQQPSSPVRP